MPTEQSCETCASYYVPTKDGRCLNCSLHYISEWVPMPAPPTPVTVAAVDMLLSRFSILLTAATSWENDAAAMLRAVRTLVEEANCKRRVDATGATWKQDQAGGPNDPILVCDLVAESKYVYIRVKTWPEAADWAEARAVKRERWSKPVRLCCFEELREIAKAIGATRHTRFMATEPLTGYVRGYAGDAWNQDTDCVKLPEEAVQRVIPDEDGGI